MPGQEAFYPESYLGDGVHASFDGYQMWLDLRGQDDTTKIAIDPMVFHNLTTFAEKVFNEKPHD